jgi:hypothetical protein
VKEIDARFTRPVFARLRRLCVALPETYEAASWGHPTFRAGTKTLQTALASQREPAPTARAQRTTARGKKTS